MDSETQQKTAKAMQEIRFVGSYDLQTAQMRHVHGGGFVSPVELES